MNILVIIGHPEKESYVKSLANAYLKGAESVGAEVNVIDLSEHEFETSKPKNFSDIEDENQISVYQKYISWADHVVWFFPIWWADVPSRVKAFFDNVFVSGFAFKYKKSKKFVKWDSYLTGKTSHIFATMDGPPWYYRFFTGEPAFKMMRYNLKFCGFKKVKRTYFGSVKMSDMKQREKWLNIVEDCGSKQGRKAFKH